MEKTLFVTSLVLLGIVLSIQIFLLKKEVSTLQDNAIEVQKQIKGLIETDAGLLKIDKRNLDLMIKVFKASGKSNP